MKYLEKQPQTNIDEGREVWGLREKVASGETSEPIGLPPGAGNPQYWQLALITAGNTGRFEYSISPREYIDNNNGNWFSWDAEDVTEKTDDSLFPVQAVRIVSVSGEVSGEIIVQ